MSEEPDHHEIEPVYDTKELLMDAGVGPSTVSLLNLGGGLPKVFGSGTFVKCGEIQGILTCAHVYDTVISQDAEIGVCAYPVSRGVFQRKSLKLEYLDGVRIPKKGLMGSEDGPDLAFIRVPDIDVNAFSHVVTVVDLDLGKVRAATDLEEGVGCFYVVSGAIEALTDVPEITDGINAGKVIDVKEVDGFDIFTFEPKLENAADEPKSYGATSGGGLWRLCLDENGERHSVCLMGVAFYETDAPRRTLKCHGPKSVYGELLDQVKIKWPTQ